MKQAAILLFSILCVSACLGGAVAPARADLRFCNQTTTSSQVIEAHVIPKEGLTVTGTVTVKAGHCGVVVPGRLSAPNYYLHVNKSGAGYGGTAHLCVLTMYSFKIEEEDAPGFRCNPKEDQHLVGVKEQLEDFFGFNMGRSTTLIVTQRKNMTFHYELR